MYTMSRLTKAFSDLLFLVQAIGAALWCIASWRKILGSTQGASMSYFLLFEGYVIFQILLLLGAYRQKPSRSTKQVMLVCGVWMLMLPPCIIVLLVRGYNWTFNDSLTMGIGLVGSVLVWWWGTRRGLTLKDPQIRSYLAIVLKATPQFLLAYKIFTEGNAGVSGIALLTGHVTVATRFIQMWIDARHYGWDRNRTWFLVAEIGNEVSWLAATLVWLLR